MMSSMCFYPADLRGCITSPPSKSAAHRALICSSLADSKSTISPLSDSQDMVATTQVLCAMGAQIVRDHDVAVIHGGFRTGHPVTLNCKESGSTFRFLLPVAAALGLDATFCGEGRLPERPIEVLASQLRQHGIAFSGDRMPFSISGRLSGGRFMLPGDVSSQFVSGLLFALPLLQEDSEIVLSSPLQSAGYVDMTIASLRQAGIVVDATTIGYQVKGRQRYQSSNKIVEGDYSNAAFWLCAGAIGGDVRVRGLNTQSVQGDRAVIEVIRQFGGDITVENDSVISRKAPLCACPIDAAPIPDLVPILAVMAAFAQGDTEIYNAGRLRIKESDRLSTVTALLRALGGSVEEFSDRLIVHGGGLRGGIADGANDHRIVMSAAIAAQFCTEPVSIIGAHAIQKSYPNFFDHLIELGGRCNVIQMG